MKASERKAAVKEYAGKFTTEEELIAALQADEKGYSDEDIAELVPLILEAKAPETPKAKAEKPKKSGGFDEWYCLINSGGEYEKMKKLRSNVGISQEQANILNEGVLHGSNAHGSIYLPAED